MDKNKLGKLGEDLAVDFLKTLDYQVLSRNYRCQIGEIDIIAQDSNKAIVFIEVKSRTNKKFGEAKESVNKQKQRKIKNVAQFYLIKMGAIDIPIRFDVIEIDLSVKRETINHIMAAF